MVRDDIGIEVNREIRRQKVRGFFIKTAGIAGIIGGGLVGASAPRTSDYVAELNREATVQQYVCDSILDKYTGITAIFKGGKENALLNDKKLDPQIKDLYREHKARGAEYTQEAAAVSDGSKHVAYSIAAHPRVAYGAFRANFGKAALTDDTTWKMAGAGAAAGGLVGAIGVAVLTRRKRK